MDGIAAELVSCNEVCDAVRQLLQTHAVAGVTVAPLLSIHRAHSNGLRQFSAVLDKLVTRVAEDVKVGDDEHARERTEQQIQAGSYNAVSLLSNGQNEKDRRTQRSWARPVSALGSCSASEWSLGEGPCQAQAQLLQWPEEITSDEKISPMQIFITSISSFLLTRLVSTSAYALNRRLMRSATSSAGVGSCHKK